MYARLRTIRKHYRLKLREFAEKIDSKLYTVSAWEAGSFRPKDEMIDKICKVFHVRREWLERGEGEMFEPDEFLKPLPKPVVDLYLSTIFSMFRQLPPQSQEGVLAILHNFKEMDERLN